jgi:hypothetical protein
LQALVQVKYSTLGSIPVGQRFATPLQGPDPSLKPTSFTGPIVEWAGQLVLKRTG